VFDVRILSITYKARIEMIFGDHAAALVGLMWCSIKEFGVVNKAMIGSESESKL
jgi:hypothetical protein